MDSFSILLVLYCLLIPVLCIPQIGQRIAKKYFRAYGPPRVAPALPLYFVRPLRHIMVGLVFGVMLTALGCYALLNTTVWMPGIFVIVFVCLLFFSVIVGLYLVVRRLRDLILPPVLLTLTQEGMAANFLEYSGRRKPLSWHEIQEFQIGGRGMLYPGFEVILVNGEKTFFGSSELSGTYPEELLLWLREYLSRYGATDTPAQITEVQHGLES